MIKVMPINEEEKPSLKDMDLLLEVFFGFFDKNGDGVISICELKQTMEDMGEKPRSGHECNFGLLTYWRKNHGILVHEGQFNDDFVLGNFVSFQHFHLSQFQTLELFGQTGSVLLPLPYPTTLLPN